LLGIESATLVKGLFNTSNNDAQESAEILLKKRRWTWMDMAYVKKTQQQHYKKSPPPIQPTRTKVKGQE